MRHADIEMYSDFTCPWCYITKRRVETAIRALPADVHARVFWRPSAVDTGWPPAAQRTSMHPMLTRLGATEGIAFAFDRIAGEPDTHDAHRLVWRAEREEQPLELINDLVERIYRAHWSEGRNIGNRSTLAEIASESGLARARAETWLAGREGAIDVQALRHRAADLGIDVIPFVLINATVGVRGTRSIEHLREAIEGASWFGLRRPARRAA